MTLCTGRTCKMCITHWYLIPGRPTLSTYPKSQTSCTMSRSTTFLCTAIGLILFADLATSYYKFHKPSTRDEVIKNIKKNTRVDYGVVTSQVMPVNTRYWIANLCYCDGAIITEMGPCSYEIDALSKLDETMRTY
jgi:hypothetical protein